MNLPLSEKRLSGLLHDPWFCLALVSGPVAWLALHFGMPAPWRGLDHDGMGLKLLLVAVLYPVLEECLFRGLIQPQLLHYRPLSRCFFGLSMANMLTSVLFSTAHLFTQPVIWAMAVLVPSLIFGAFRDRYQSVVPGMILHAYYNLGFFLWVQ